MREKRRNRINIFQRIDTECLHGRARDVVMAQMVRFYQAMMGYVGLAGTTGNSRKGPEFGEQRLTSTLDLAERVGFEPTVGANPRQFSRLLP